MPGRTVSDDAAAARVLSPLHRLDDLSARTRILLVHGEGDPRVPREHGDQVTACRLRGYGHAGTRNDRLAEAVTLSTGRPIPAQ